MTAMRAALALLALLAVCVSAQDLAVNGAFDGCAVNNVATGYNNDLGSASVLAYFTVGPPPAVFGACLTDFLDSTGTTDTNIEQDVTGATAGVAYTITITVGNTQPGGGAITFTLLAGDTALTTSSIGSVVVAEPAVNADPTTATLTGTFTPTGTDFVVQVTSTPGTFPIADNLGIVDPSSVSDPHFIGFQGQVFDFIGQADTAYNLLTDFDVQFNTFLFLRRQTHHSFIPGPVMKELVCMVDGHVVYITCGGYEKPETGYVTVDGQRLVDGQKVSQGRLSVGYKAVSAWSKDYGMAGKDYIVGVINIHIEGAYAFHIALVENGRNINNPNIWVTALPQRYLDFTAHIIDHSRLPHGVFGQTARLDVPRDQWTIEGEEEDYILKDGLFGSDFTFNKFQH